MSKKYPGGYLTKTPPTVSTTSAQGVWTLEQAEYYQNAGLWPVPPDPYFNQVSLLLHGDGTNGSQNNTFLDSSTNNFTITRTGNVAQGTFSPFSLAEGQWSNSFTSSGGGILSTPSTTAFQFGTGNWCLEGFYYPTSNSGYQVLFCFGYNSSDGFTFVCDNGRPYFNITGSYGVAYSSTAFNLNTWNHFAASKSGSTLSIFMNGVRVSTAAYSGNISGTYPLTIGVTTLASPLNGYASNFRAVSGSSVYDPTQTTCTVPTAPLTAISGTQLLTCQSNRFKDNSSNNFTITPAGDAKVTAFSPFAPSAAYSASTNGGSGYFDGSGDYLSAGTQSALSVDANNWTLETWIYRTNASNFDGIFSQWVGGGQMAVRVNSSSRIETYFYTTTNLQLNATTTSVVANQWNHVALVRNGTTITLYVNGVADATTLNVGTAAITWYGGTVKETKIGYYIDNGSPLTGYLSNLRFVIGTAVYTSNFTPPTAPLTAVTNTQLLINCVNAGIIDNAGKNDIETVGNAQISTSVKKYGTGSMYFDGSGDRLYSAFNGDIGSGDFTLEAWIYPTTINNTHGILATPNTNTGSWVFGLNSSGNLRWFANATSNTVNLNEWNHIVACRASGSIRLFINGILGATISDTTNYSQSPFVIGTERTLTVDYFGYIDDLRITKGVARYTANFTPPNGPFPNV